MIGQALRTEDQKHKEAISDLLHQVPCFAKPVHHLFKDLFDQLHFLHGIE